MPRPVSKAELLTKIRHFVVEDAIGVTALRGQEEKTRATVIRFLKRLYLSSIPSKRAEFVGWLDDRTERLRRRLPRKQKDKDRLWGVARKALNLFLRSCLYNHYLRREHDLRRIQGLLEIPLDSVVAKKLIKKDKKKTLPRWLGLKSLTPEMSGAFQQQAKKMAKEMRLPAPVFLDNFLWLAKRQAVRRRKGKRT